MLERLQKLLDRIESRIALWSILQGSGILSVGAISAWIASATAWLDAYGTIGWWFAGLVGAILAALALMGFAGLRYLWAKASAIHEWKKQVNSVNPLENDFTKLRLRFVDLANPIGNDIGYKRFTDCELMGPANIALAQEGVMDSVRFQDCDVVAVKEKAHVNNVIVIHNSRLINCVIWKCTVFIPREMAPMFAKMNAPFITLTGDQGIDTQSPSGTAPGTQPRTHPG
jgi:hypothetical protein